MSALFDIFIRLVAAFAAVAFAHFGVMPECDDARASAEASRSVKRSPILPEAPEALAMVRP